MNAPRRRAATLDADVAIIGAGVVGMTLAAALARAAELRVIVLERQPATSAPVGYDPRTLALTPAAQQLLEFISVWPRLDARRNGCFRRMEVWEPGGGRIVFDCADIGAPTLGTIIENNLLLGALDATLASEPRVSVRRARSIAALDPAPDSVRLTLADGAALTVRFVVGADGVASRVRALAGIEFDQRDYGQTALTCIVRTEISHAETARQVFLPHGPLAFLPLGDPHLCAIVWSTRLAHADTLAALPTEVFLATLGAAIESALGTITWCGPRECHALTHGRARRYVGARVVLIGDAAHVVHPLAGQGANLGLMDAAALVQSVTAAIAAGRDPGAERTLRQYERWRKGENLLMQTAVDGLRSLFAAEAAAVRRLRSAGLGVVDATRPLKRFIMRRASGLSGDVPQLGCDAAAVPGGSSRTFGD